MFCHSTSHIAPSRHKDLSNVIFDHVKLFFKAKPMFLLNSLSETFFPLFLATSIQVEVVKHYLPNEAPTSSGSKSFPPLDPQEPFVHGLSHTMPRLFYILHTCYHPLTVSSMWAEIGFFFLFPWTW